MTEAALDSARGSVRKRGVLVAYNGADAGLGNRMRVTLGAANLAQATGRKFYYVWPQTPKFEPAIGDLWHWRGGRRISRGVSRSLARFTGYYDEHLAEIAKDSSRPVWQIRTGAGLDVPDGVVPWTETFRELRPVRWIEDAVRDTFERELRGHPYIGVQIRVAPVSHRVTREASPLEWYVDRMAAIRSQHPDVKFYLSCDVPTVKRELVDRFGASAIMNDARYNSSEAVGYAVADLYLLASAVRILGPHHSSFIQMAEHLSHPLVEAEKARETERSMAWDNVPLTSDPLRPYER